MSIDYIPVSGVGVYVTLEDLILLKVFKDENSLNSEDENESIQHIFYKENPEAKGFIYLSECGDSFSNKIKYVLIIKNLLENDCKDILNKIEKFKGFLEIKNLSNKNIEEINELYIF